MNLRARAAHFLAAATLGSVAALAGCNAIVGVGDYAVGGAGSDATSGQPPDDAGVMPTADANGANPPIDAARDVGNGMPKDAGGRPGADGAACGQGVSTGQAAFQNILRACVLAVSCDPFYFNVNISDCVTYDFLNSSGSVACLSTIQDCAGFFNCTGRRAATATECPTGSKSLSCDPTGTFTIDCVNSAVRDCRKYSTNPTCQTFLDTSGANRVGCVVVPSCQPGDGGFECTADKSTLFSCAPSGVGYGTDCTVINATCESPTGGPSCYYKGAACNAAGVDTCSNGALVSCSAAGQVLNFNCGATGQDCLVDDAGIGFCRARGCPLTMPCVESCHADLHTMTICAGGVPFDVDCAAQPGFTSCSSSTRSSTSTVYAYCRP
jgi:hypothetical protein